MKMTNKDRKRIDREKAERRRAELVETMLTVMVDRAGGEVTIENLEEYGGRRLGIIVTPVFLEKKVVLKVVDMTPKSEEPDGETERQGAEPTAA